MAKRRSLEATPPACAWASAVVISPQRRRSLPARGDVAKPTIRPPGNISPDTYLRPKPARAILPSAALSRAVSLPRSSGGLRPALASTVTRPPRSRRSERSETRLNATRPAVASSNACGSPSVYTATAAPVATIASTCCTTVAITPSVWLVRSRASERSELWTFALATKKIAAVAPTPRISTNAAANPGRPTPATVRIRLSLRVTSLASDPAAADWRSYQGNRCFAATQAPGTAGNPSFWARSSAGRPR